MELVVKCSKNAAMLYYSKCSVNDALDDIREQPFSLQSPQQIKTTSHQKVKQNITPHPESKSLLSNLVTKSLNISAEDSEECLHLAFYF